MINFKKDFGQYSFDKMDKKEIKSLLIFLHGVTIHSPLRKIIFERSKNESRLVIQRYNNENEKLFTQCTVRYSTENNNKKPKQK